MWRSINKINPTKGAVAEESETDVLLQNTIDEAKIFQIIHMLLSNQKPQQVPKQNRQADEIKRKQKNINTHATIDCSDKS